MEGMVTIQQRIPYYRKLPMVRLVVPTRYAVGHHLKDQMNEAGGQR